MGDCDSACVRAMSIRSRTCRVRRPRDGLLRRVYHFGESGVLVCICEGAACPCRELALLLVSFRPHASGDFPSSSSFSSHSLGLARRPPWTMFPKWHVTRPSISKKSTAQNFPNLSLQRSAQHFAPSNKRTRNSTPHFSSPFPSPDHSPSAPPRTPDSSFRPAPSDPSPCDS